MRILLRMKSDTTKKCCHQKSRKANSISQCSIYVKTPVDFNKNSSGVNKFGTGTKFTYNHFKPFAKQNGFKFVAYINLCVVL